MSVESRVERDTYHEGVVERREDVRNTEHVLALARVGEVGLPLLHHRGGSRFRISLREEEEGGERSAMMVPGSARGCAGRRARGSRTARICLACRERVRWTHHVYLRVSGAATRARIRGTPRCDGAGFCSQYFRYVFFVGRTRPTALLRLWDLFAAGRNYGGTPQGDTSRPVALCGA